MNKLNNGRQHVIDPPSVKRTAYLVEASDVGKTQRQYLGTDAYTFKSDDVGRLVEVTTGYSPGYISWKFTSMFEDLRKQYPDHKPYRVTE